MYWYKIVDKDMRGNFKTLFHGINRTKIIPAGEWVRSEQKTVRDGSVGTQYLSGWHIMMNLDEAQEYLTRFTRVCGDKRIIVEIDVRGKIWAKEHSPSNVHLCEYIKIIGEV
jgi:hypothetical protein